MGTLGRSPWFATRSIIWAADSPEYTLKDEDRDCENTQPKLMRIVDYFQEVQQLGV